MENCLFQSFVHENSIFLNENTFSTSCALVVENRRKATRNKHSFPHVLCRLRSSGTPPPTWSSRFDTAAHLDSPGRVLFCSLCFFRTAVFTVHLKLSQLGFGALLLGANTPLWTCFKASMLSMQSWRATFSLRLRLLQASSLLAWEAS